MVTYATNRGRVCVGLVAFAALAAGPAMAEGPEAPLARTMLDAGLAWGPCPPVFPAGCEIAVLHGNPATPNADVFFKVPANYSIPHHWHSSAERMVLVSGEMHVTYDGHETAILRPGTYAYGPPAAPHVAECKDAGPCVLFIAFEGPVDVQTSQSKP
jgi:mannose-6-phosphate isomerase-like protein (cupin superfamily)